MARVDGKCARARYHATKDRLQQSRMLVGDGQDWKGMLSFCLKEFKDVTFQITTKSKLSITYPQEIDYHSILKELQPLLVKADRTPAEIVGVIKETKREDLLEQKVEKAIEDLRFRLLRNPTIKEVAYEVGEAPQLVSVPVWRLAPKMEWREPKELEFTGARSFLLPEVYAIATLLEHFKETTVEMYPRPNLQQHGFSWEEVLRRAKYALEHERDKLPQVIIEKEDEERVEFYLIWHYGEAREIYDKKTRQFVSK